MSSWGNTDSIYDKPHWDVERQVRPNTYLTLASTVSSGNTLTFTGANSAVLANVTAGMYVYAANVGLTGEALFFTSNNTVKSVSTNVVVLSANVFGSVPAGTVVYFGDLIRWKANTQANTYNPDTILVTATRLANANVKVSNTHTGWTHVYRTVEASTGDVRYRSEVLVVTANAVATNANSGNTSTSQIFRGV